ncbi:MAG: hypothetical protein WC249_00140 [Patescibacteria group bacterium]
MNKKIIIISFLTVLFFSFFGPITKAFETPTTLEGLNQTAGTIPAFQGKTENAYNSTYFAGYAGGIVGIILSFIGVLFLGLMIYAGIMWMMAQGNEQQITKAKDLITNSIIGLIIVFAAYAITTFIGSNFINQ